MSQLKRKSSEMIALYRNGPQPMPSGYRYSVYGISIHSQFPIPLPESSEESSVAIEIQFGTSSFFSQVTQGAHIRPISCYEHAQLEDGSSYVCWDHLGEFHVSPNGQRITCRRFDEAHVESFQVYLLGQALSFALVKCGLEPIHATCVVIDGEAVAFLGASGFGKSSLASCFVQAGNQLLTDDLLLLREVSGEFYAYPGPSRIKLFPGTARKLMQEPVRGVPMNSGTAKMVIPLTKHHVHGVPAPLRAIYALTPPRQAKRAKTVTIKSLSPRDAFMMLLTNTFNYVVLQPERLQRHFAETHRVVDTVPIKSLSYPRLLRSLPLVRQAILADMKHTCEMLACQV